MQSEKLARPKSLPTTGRDQVTPPTTQPNPLTNGWASWFRSNDRRLEDHANPARTTEPLPMPTHSRHTIPVRSTPQPTRCLALQHLRQQIAQTSSLLPTRLSCTPNHRLTTQRSQRQSPIPSQPVPARPSHVPATSQPRPSHVPATSQSVPIRSSDPPGPPLVGPAAGC